MSRKDPALGDVLGSAFPIPGFRNWAHSPSSTLGSSGVQGAGAESSRPPVLGPDPTRQQQLRISPSFYRRGDEPQAFGDGQRSVPSVGGVWWGETT